MECRRLIQFGRSSYVISLPKKWITHHKLNKGDLLFVFDSGDKLVVSPSVNDDKEPRRTIISEHRDAEHLRSALISAYLHNYDDITVIGETHQDILKDLVSTLPGLEIVDYGARKMVIKDFLSHSEISLTQLFRRVDHIVRSMIEDAKRGEDVTEQDDDINRLVFLVKRVLRGALDNPSVARTLDLDTASLLRDWQMIGYLESAGDEIKRLARHKHSDEVRALLDRLGKSYAQVMRSYHTREGTHAREVALETPRRSTRVEEIVRGQKLDYGYHLRAFSAVVKNMARLCTDFL